ncbi:MAG: putative ubiquitin ligase E3A [Streblomastix strix]|uniref:HECT-type E3 ubiquitin transferase n=1 Tax=Streblomastix strix TaxID=222440 RepID=A0A5J4U2U9_9EUKA|nr:MAG: putative ubiquitin ligase E3A [Streblomastix strix]
MEKEKEKDSPQIKQQIQKQSQNIQQSYITKEDQQQILREYKLIGNVLGLAIYNSVLLDLHFPQALYKKLLNIQPNLKDLEEVKPEVALSLKKLLEADDAQLFDLTFSITKKSFGQIINIDLCANGSEIVVTNQNREQFVSLYIDWYFNKAIQPAFEQFKIGFNDTVGDLLHHIVSPSELQLLVIGQSALDFEELESTTQYDGGFDKKDPTIRKFWDILNNRNLQKEHRQMVREWEKDLQEQEAEEQKIKEQQKNKLNQNDKEQLKKDDIEKQEQNNSDLQQTTQSSSQPTTVQSLLDKSSSSSSSSSSSQPTPPVKLKHKVSKHAPLPPKLFTEEDKRRFLHFVTSSSRAPIGGLKEIRMIIQRNGPDSDMLPTAHTCFNILLLPGYKSRMKIRQKLLTAINNAEGFGLR